ncbi:MAG: response regulator [Acidobacteriaceae bacterium]|nr:response regulator [Acidobacteriaceae bacterium]
MTERTEVDILLVEDNPADMGLIEEAFEDGRLLCRLHMAEDGEAALQFLRRKGRFAGAARPDLVLLDLNLPKKDGREVLEEIKSDPALRHIPIVVLTTSDDEADVLRAYGLHANCYLTKPVAIEDFMLKIRSIEEFWFTMVRLPQARAAATG